MERTGASVEEFVSRVTPARRQEDARTLIAMMRQITGLDPEMWTGNIIGFGDYHLHYESGREGDCGALGFAPRKASLVVYLVDGVGHYRDHLTRLGPHKAGVGCLYLTSLGKIDMEVLRDILTASHARLTSGTFTLRAREAQG